MAPLKTPDSRLHKLETAVRRKRGGRADGLVKVGRHVGSAPKIRHSHRAAPAPAPAIAIAGVVERSNEAR